MTEAVFADVWDTSSASREAVTASMSMFYRQAPCITQEGMDALLKSGFTRGVDPTRKASVVFDKTDRMNKRPTAILAEGLSRTAAMAADAMEYGYVTDKEIQRVVGLGRLYVSDAAEKAHVAAKARAKEARDKRKAAKALPNTEDITDDDEDLDSEDGDSEAATGSAPTLKPQAKRKRAAHGNSSTDDDSDTHYRGSAAAAVMQPRARLTRACTLMSTELAAAELAANLPQRVMHLTDLAGQAGFDWS